MAVELERQLMLEKQCWRSFILTDRLSDPIIVFHKSLMNYLTSFSWFTKQRRLYQENQEITDSVEEILKRFLWFCDHAPDLRSE